MNIGNFNDLALIERKVVTQDPNFGTELISWQTVDQVWANVHDVPPSKAESVQLGVAVARNLTRFRTRYRSDLDSSMRVTLYRPSAITYQIVAGPAELGRKEGIELMLERISS